LNKIHPVKDVTAVLLDMSDEKATKSKNQPQLSKLNSLVQKLEQISKKNTITFSSFANFLNQYPNLKSE
jgi:hypothetical protein